MKQTKIRTKIDLLKALDNLTKVDNEYLSVNSDKYKKVKEHKDLIQLIATGLPKTADISDLSSLDFGEQSLEEYVKNNSVETVEKRLISIDSDINTRTSQYANTYFEKKEADKKKEDVVIFSNHLIEFYNDMQQKGHKARIVMRICFIVFTTIFLAAAICLFVDSFHDFLKDEQEKIPATICTIAGAFDYMNGWVFSMYEHNDDKKKAKVYSTAKDSLNTGNPIETFNEKIQDSIVVRGNMSGITVNKTKNSEASSGKGCNNSIIVGGNSRGFIFNKTVNNGGENTNENNEKTGQDISTTKE